MDDEKKVIVCFKDKIEPLMDALEDDNETFGLLMRAMFNYSLYGEVTENFADKFQEYAYSQLVGMVDRANEGNREYQVNQIIKANLRYAKSEDDMRTRLERKGLTDDEIDAGLDRFKKKQNADAGMTSDGQFPKGTDWETVRKIRGF